MLENRFITFLMERIEEEVGELPESQKVNLVMFTKELRGALDVLLKNEIKSEANTVTKQLKRGKRTASASEEGNFDGSN